MSFAAVTAPALLALQQTGTFNKQMQQLGKATIAFFSIPVQAGWCQAAFWVIQIGGLESTIDRSGVRFYHSMSWSDKQPIFY